ncbi:MAG: transglutaminase [bacterium]|nr:MAG: transglutaminase [bacterium]
MLLQFGTLIGPASGVALLVFLSGAKLLEMDSARDRSGLLFVGIFLLVAHFLDAQSLLTAAYMALAAVVLVAGLMVAPKPAAPARAETRGHLALAARLLAQALPLALLLFVLFPRLPGPLWGLPQQAAGKSGLSERMAPGDISQLILSDELAFRAEFADTRLQSRQLYWRGPVLWDYDGRAWSTTTPVSARPPDFEARGAPVHVAVTLEPHQQRWLFLPGAPARLPATPPSTLASDLQWLARDPLRQRLRYELEAYLDYRLQPRLDSATRARGLALPAESDPRARQLASAWRQAAADDAAIVERALAWFRAEPFHYTLNPPLLGAAAVDDFLFGTRRGFCEHYASTFVFLMRAAGVPARVVTGYQGGELNQLGNHWIVRGRDAHAWAEVWLPERGWMRVDPTAAVAPERVERGLNAALPAAERPAALVALQGGWLRPLRLGLDLLNSRWNEWVLGYNQERQRRFLAGLHPLLASLQGMLIALIVVAAAALLLLAVRLYRRPPQSRDRAARAYDRFCRRLARLDLRRTPAEGAHDFAVRAAAARPDLAADIDDITRRYVALRYGPAGADRLGELEVAVRAFRPARHGP